MKQKKQKITKHWFEFEKEFSDHVIDWFEEKDLDGAQGCRLLVFLLCSVACSYGYSQEEFKVSVRGLDQLFISIKKKHEILSGHKPKTE